MTLSLFHRAITPAWSVLLLHVAVATAAAQQLTYVPDHANATYAVGERVAWTIRPAAGTPAPGGSYTYTIKRDGREVIKTGAFDLTSGAATIETSCAQPAMLLVEIKPPSGVTGFGAINTGGPGRVLLAAAVAPTSIQPVAARPADFDAFWDAKLKQLAAVPMNATLTPGDGGKPGVEYATLKMNNINGAHVYGQLAKPARDGKFPALLIFQWASPPYPLQKSWVADRAAEGWLVLNVEPHDVPSDMPQAFYDALPQMIKSYHTIGQHSRDDSYFLSMYLGDYRAVEYLASRPDWDGTTMVVMGTSMGGQQSLAVAGLNARVTGLIVNVPAGADVTASLHGHATGYPNWNVARADVLATAPYFDTVNFASRISATSLVAMGFIDEVAPSIGIWTAFNQIKGKKEAAPMTESAHNNLATAAQQLPYTRRSAEWLSAFVHGSDPMANAGKLP